jgi:serine protease inhibitor ecotin
LGRFRNSGRIWKGVKYGKVGQVYGRMGIPKSRFGGGGECWVLPGWGREVWEMGKVSSEIAWYLGIL